MALVALAALPEPRSRPDRRAGSGELLSLRQTLGFMGAQRSLAFLYFTAPLATAAQWSLATWLGAFLMRSHGLDIRAAGLAMGLYGFMGALGNGAGGALIDRMSRGAPRRQLLISALGMMIAAVGVVVAMLTTHVALAITLSLLVGLCSGATQPIVSSNMIAVVGTRMRGLAVSALQLLMMLVGVGIAPFLIGALSDGFGGGGNLRYAILIVGSATWLIASVNFFLAAKNIEADRERAADYDRAPSTTEQVCSGGT